MTRRRPRRWAILGIAAGVGLVLSACVSIPTSGPVNIGNAIKAEGVDGGAAFIPEGPTPGGTQQQILEGFIAAFTGSQNNYAVAREFLASGFKDTWDPRKNVLVRTGGSRLESLGGQTMTYSINTVAAVDSAGSYTRSPQAESQTLNFQFAKQNGQWRITDAPQGIVLLESTFESIFSEQTLYFLDPTGKRLVPDRRWFPVGARAVRIVSALLAGPPPALRGAVYSAFPEGTTLPSPLVPIDNSVAKVDLSVEALTAKPNDRQLMRLQLLASLSTVPNIASVAISVGGSLLSIPDPQSTDPQPDPQVDPRALVLQNGSFGFYDNGKVATIPALSAKILTLKPTAVTLGSGGDTAVVRSDAGVFAVKTGDPAPQLLDNRPGLIAPSLDEDGYVWSVPRTSPNAIRIFDFAGKAHDLAPALPADAQIVSLEVSRDGARVAMFLATSAGPRLVVSAIVRSADQNQLPVSLVNVPILDVTATSGTAIDATWADGLSVAALSSVNGQSTVLLYQLGGQRTSLGRPNEAQAIVGGNHGTAGLRVLGTDGAIQTLLGSGWISSAVKVTFIAGQR
ncbi:MAG: LpqB family beta-propeller domain-containing protein [Lacisediminihabitans sp.]